MIKEIAWNTFKNTGNIDTFLEIKNIEDISEANSLKNPQSLLLKKGKERGRVISEAMLSGEASKLVADAEHKE